MPGDCPHLNPGRKRILAAATAMTPAKGSMEYLLTRQEALRI